jgi:isopenicillin-N N-acyltransferase like protein
MELLKRTADIYVSIPGLADGAGVILPDIIACNVRTEIAFGMFSDGCTALSWRTSNSSWLAQNWDWMEAQKQNLIVLTITQRDKPTIKMVTEAGLIGKIGLNSAGVGVCLNAIRMKGMDATKLPCHLGLRMVLESNNRDEAVQRLEEYGIASACHMLIADATGGIGLEWSSTDVQKCTMNDAEQVFHSNHYLLDHPGTNNDTKWLKDSSYRVTRIEELAKMIDGMPTKESLFEIFKDEGNFPGSICRAQKAPSESASLFNIIMDLKARTADVTLGRPMQPEDYVHLAF